MTNTEHDTDRATASQLQDDPPSPAPATDAVPPWARVRPRIEWGEAQLQRLLAQRHVARARPPLERCLRALRHWFQRNTFLPAWLPARWAHPGIGYLAVVIAQCLALLVDTLLISIFPAFAFPGVLVILAVLVIALTFGAGPSIFAALFGVLLIDYVVLPPRFAWRLSSLKEVVEFGLLLAVGLTMSVVAGRVERARRTAETLAGSLIGSEREAALRANELDALFEAMTAGIFVYDRESRITRMNAAARALLGLTDEAERAFSARPLHERIHALRMRGMMGQELTPESWVVARALKGEVITSAHAEEVTMGTFDGRDLIISMTGAPLRDASGQVVGAVAVCQDVTDRRRVERQLRQSERQFRAIFEQAASGIALATLDGHFVRANQRLCDMLGYAADELETLTFREITSPDDLATDLVLVERLVTGEITSYTREKRYVRKDGSLIWVEVNLTLAPPDEATGEPGHLVAVVLDITARKAAEAEHADLLAREQTARAEAEALSRQLRGVLDVLPVGVAIAGAQGQGLAMNAALTAIWGEHIPIAAGMEQYQQYRAWWPATGQLVAPEEWALSRALRAGETTASEDMDIETFDGQRKTILSAAAPLRDNHGAITGGVSVIVDVTDQRRVERRTREVLDALLTIAHALVWVRDAPDAASPAPADGDRASDEQRAMASRLAMLTRTVLGCQRVGIVSIEPETQLLRPVAVVGLAPEQERTWWAEQEQQQVRFGEGADPELLARFVAGEALMIDMTEPPYDELPNPYGVTTSLMAPMRIASQVIGLLSLDFGGAPHHFTTEEKHLAEAVANLAAVVIERERLVRERAAAQATALVLEEINQRMNDFMGIAGHELRTPLTSAKANVQLAGRQLQRMLATLPERDTLAERLARLRDLILRTDRQILRQERLVADMLDMSRIQSGKLDLRLEPCDLVTIIHEVVEEQRLLQADRVITLDFPASERPVGLVADADRIGQVVTNYLTNALKYSLEEAPVAVRLRVEGQIARVSVRDEGPGLPPEERVRVWERFHRAPGVEVLSGSGIGLGLGLYISREIIERHGGQAGVESTPGLGSTFWFTLPLAPAPPR